MCFLDNKLKYFEDGTYNYNKFPKDISSNSVLERYNKIIKTDLNEKRTCNWVIFLNFINNEILRINNIFGKNENINILYAEKGTKFSKEKFVGNINLNIDNKNKTIAHKWLVNQLNNCRYNSFITIFYFIISPFIYQIDDKNLDKVKELNNLNIKLSKDVTYKNFLDIAIYMQKLM